MNVYLVCGIVLIALVVLMELMYRGRRDDGTADGTGDAGAVPLPDNGTVCCGKHTVCVKKRLAEAMEHDAVYYEDEELDIFKGHPSDGYSDDEIESFRYVMDTMKPEEVRGWLESLQVRGIELPDELKDEAWMMIER